MHGSVTPPAGLWWGQERLGERWPTAGRDDIPHRWWGSPWLVPFQGGFREKVPWAAHFSTVWGLERLYFKMLTPVWRKLIRGFTKCIGPCYLLIEVMSAWTGLNNQVISHKVNIIRLVTWGEIKRNEVKLLCNAVAGRPVCMYLSESRFQVIRSEITWKKKVFQRCEPICWWTYLDVTPSLSLSFMEILLPWK